MAEYLGVVPLSREAFVRWLDNWSLREPPLEFDNNGVKTAIQYEPQSDRILIYRFGSSEPTMADVSKAMGKATWVWDEDLQCHVPCCTYTDPFDQRPCANGPLTEEQIATGDCGQHPEGEKIELSPEVAKIFREDGVNAGFNALLREGVDKMLKEAEERFPQPAEPTKDLLVNERRLDGRRRFRRG